MMLIVLIGRIAVQIRLKTCKTLQFSYNYEGNCEKFQSDKMKMGSEIIVTGRNLCQIWL